MSKEKLQVIIIHETLYQSILRDLASAATLLALVWIGIWVDSPSLQWVAGLTWILWLMSRAAREVKKNRCTIEEARKRLDEIEARAA